MLGWDKMAKRIVCTVLMVLSSLTLCFCNYSPESNEESARRDSPAEPDVVFVATPPKVVREMLKLAGVTSDDVVYDLGCGDGRIVIAAAKDFGATGVGIDIDPKLVAESKENARKAHVSERVTFVEGDVFKADIRRATAITLYMLSSVNKQLLPKFFRELRPGTRVVSHRFEIGAWKPDMTLKAHGTTIYQWTIPADVRGDWHMRLSNGEETREYLLTLTQKYQEVEGSLSAGGKKLKLAATTLQGEEITISVADTIGGRRFMIELEGCMKGDTFEGTARITDAKHPLTAGYSCKGRRSLK
jgi:SAM-dependent methyltransferase